LWIAQRLSSLLPESSVLHLGILNSLRAWNFFEVPKSVDCYSNVGGFGIDGGVSTLIGASLANRDRLCFGIIGDLAFFYDMNSLGNRHIGNNIRLMLINNGVGTEFKNYSHPASRFGDSANQYMAAAGHYGNKSPMLVKHYAEDLGFEYMSASNKEEFESVYKRFVTNESLDKSIIFEVFTNSQDESDALYAMSNIYADSTKKMADVVRSIFGDSAVQTVKKIIGK
jgi:2-succinyl-5-enolpyruvyl-6-hydroxy-3-cyclohexene-1-carboxylate synthase